MVWNPEVVHRVASFYTMNEGDDLWYQLIDNGIRRRPLRQFLSVPGRPKKHPERSHQGQVTPLLGDLLDAGGVISGGAALDSVLQEHRSRDIDLFFNDFTAYVQATLDSYYDPRIDVIFYSGQPWDTFDIDVPAISISRQGVEISPQARRAITTGISNIVLSNVVYPEATLGRVAKYGARGFRFPRSQIQSLRHHESVTRSTYDAALHFAV